MNRKEFMDELSRLLNDLPEDERNSALEYYFDYFEDAGVEYEEEVMKELGSPEQLANTIKAELGMVSTKVEEEPKKTQGTYRTEQKEQKEYTGGTYRSQETKQKSPFSSGVNHAKNAAAKARDGANRNTGIIIVIVLLLIATCPIWLGVGGGLLGIVLGAVGVLFGLCVALAAVTAALLIAGVVTAVVGFVTIFAHPGTGLLTIGIGLLLFVAGMLFLLLSIKFYGTFLPWLFNTIGRACRSLIHGKGGEAA